MFADLDYKHTARVRRDSWFMRLYCWMWDAEPSRVDFCKLVWGTVFAIPNLLIRALIFPFVLLFKGARAVVLAVASALAIAIEKAIAVLSPIIRKITPKPKPKPYALHRDPWKGYLLGHIYHESQADRKARLKRRRQERWERLFEGVGRGTARGVLAAQTAWHYLRYPVYVLVGALALAIGALAIWLLYMFSKVLALFVNLVIENLNGIWGVALFVLGLLGICLVVVVVALGVVFFFTETDRGDKVGTGIQTGVLGFGGALKTGVRGIKSNTCPKIELVDE